MECKKCKVRPLVSGDQMYDAVIKFCPLHAAAGEMLETCKFLVEGALQSEAQKALGSYSITATVVIQARKAIAKAEGKSPA